MYLGLFYGGGKYVHPSDHSEPEVFEDLEDAVDELWSRYSDSTGWVRFAHQNETYIEHQRRLANGDHVPGRFQFPLVKTQLDFPGVNHQARLYLYIDEVDLEYPDRVLTVNSDGIHIAGLS